MPGDKIRIGVVAPGKRLEEDVAERLVAFAARNFPRAELHIHPQCFLSHGHFAGPDETRANAFLEVANDPRFDALWWARGGYGAGRVAPLVLPHLSDVAKKKIYLGYSDAGFILAGLYRAGFPFVVHGPVARDIARDGGEAAVARALSFLTTRDPATMEPNLSAATPAVAFNLCVLSHIVGTDLMPDLGGHVLMLEEVSEELYRIDRSLCHIASVPEVRGCAGLRLGRVTDILPNDPDFGATPEEIARHWCRVSGIAWLGAADIGHDVENRIVPFGRWPWPNI